ncbi:7-cyano-7-deazaguanine/7-aminomethyl-7-deazaguanine transporter [Candidatus Sororendozoicomonas aggregata]|uniref:7-cyano-7-deazaguanine/7-aminomethyl-7- deazaguanine transporter n=1 Tax=Candidatus Sororendozoicomonas aggregata TaxID=3073239 RepID=UPI002ED3C2A0
MLKPSFLPRLLNDTLAIAPLCVFLSLVVFHMGVLTLSNYLVQIPVDIADFHNTWGTFSFPLVYLATDLTVRLYGAPLARRVIACVMVPALIFSYGISVLFQQGVYQGVEALAVFNLFVARIAFASFSAYLTGQLLDVTVMNRLRRLKQWWVAPAMSTIAGNALDTAAFYSVAFYQSTDAFMANNWVEIGLLDYGFKLIACLFLSLPLYGVLLSYLERRLPGISLTSPIA